MNRDEHEHHEDAATGPPALDAPERVGPTDFEIRFWATEEGLPCPEHERIPDGIRQAYLEAHPQADGDSG